MEHAYSSLDTGSDSLFQNECDVCLTHAITSEALFYCEQCCEHLCKGCEQAHTGSRASKDHSIVTESAILSRSKHTPPILPFMFCDRHKRSLLESYCTTHDEVICTLCKMTNHTQCDTMDVSRHVTKNNVFGTFRTVVQTLSEFADKFRHIKKRIYADKTFVEEQIETCLQEMHQLRKNVNDKMDHLEKKMSAEIQDIRKNRDKDVDSQNAISKNVLLQIGDLKTSLNQCEQARDDKVVFVWMKKVCGRIVEFEKIIMNMQKDIYPIEIHLEPNYVLADVITKLQSLGTLVTDQPTRRNRPTSTSLLNMEVTVRQEINLRSTHVSSCVFMSDGHLVIGCSDSSLKLFDKDFQLKSKLHISSYDVTAVNDSDVMITHGGLKQIQRVRVLPNVVMKTPLEIGRNCWGIDVFGDEIFVTCYDSPIGNGEVQVLDMDGKLQRRLGVDNGKYIFTTPTRIKVNTDGSKLVVSDMDSHIVTCMSIQGHVIYQYSGKDAQNSLRSPRGLFIDAEDNILVCGWGSDNVHIVRHDGKKEKIVLSRQNGLLSPIGISYRRSDGCLAVAMGKGLIHTRLVIFSSNIKPITPLGIV